jgi:pimeloyl-ACP methyl ester esterase
MALLTTADNVLLHYQEAGSGPPLVFLHGWLMSGRVWHYQQELADRFRVITLDLRGHGQSGPGTGYGFAELVGDLEALCGELQLDRVTLVGWSLGAQLALAAAERLAGRLAALVLVGGTPRFCTASDYPHGLPPVEAKGMGLRLRRNMAQTAGAFFKGMFAAGELTIGQYQELARTVVGRLPDLAVALAALESLATVDLRPALARITVPTQLLHGTADSICLPGASRFMADQLPAARLQLLDGVGHAPFLTRPQQFNALVREFLQVVYDQD